MKKQEFIRQTKKALTRMSKKSNDPAKGGLPRVPAPCCGHAIDSATTVEALKTDAFGPGVQPKENDLSICLNCGTILVYVDPAANRLRVAGPRDLVDTPSDVLYELAEAKKAIDTLKKRRGARP